jgi:hypothetical protein
MNVFPKNTAITLALLLGAFVANLGGVALGQAVSISASINPAELVRKAVANEVASSNTDTNFMFRDEKQASDGSQTKLVVETRDAMVGLLISINGQPLTPEQKQAENDRLNRLINDPVEMKKKAKREKEDAERTTRIVGAFPDAFLYEADGFAPGEEGLAAPGDKLVRLKFRPNPQYSPPSHVEQILTGLEGYMLIDGQQNRIAKIDGTLVKEVGFGWGILGHLDRGGHFIVQQGDLGQGHWEITQLDLSFTGKALFFKTINIKEKEVFSCFQPAPRNLSFAEGVELLKKQEAQMAQNPKAQTETKTEKITRAMPRPPGL